MKEIFVEPVQNASHSLVLCIFRLLRMSHSETERSVMVALHREQEAWEHLSEEALESLEKRFG